MIRRLSPPADLRTQATRLQSVNALARHYGHHRGTIRKWLRLAEIDTVGWHRRHMTDRLTAITASDLRQHPTRDRAKTALGLGSSTVTGLAIEHQVVWMRRSRLQRLAQRLSAHSAAADYLAQANGDCVIDMGPDYSVIHKGRRYCIGRHRYTAAEIIERAIKMGFKP